MAFTQSYTASSHDHSYSNSPSSSRHSPTRHDLTRLNSSTPSSSAASNVSLSKKQPRRSLSVLGSLPKEISALIRSHSLSRRETPQIYNQNTHGDTDEMFLDDDRPSRRSKYENKLYNFLTRSRSRSRSKNGQVPASEPVPDLPQSSRARSDSTGPSTPSKPPSRLQSRPLSSTTTATNTTITPGTPRPKKRPPAAVPVLQSHKDTNSQHPSETSKSSSTRKKLHTLFGIPLSSPRKSSFGSSRQSSRRPSFEALPPLPGFENEIGNIDIGDNDPTPRPRKSFSPHPNSRPESPTPSPRLKSLTPNTSTSSTSSTNTSSRLRGFFSGRGTPPPVGPSTDNVSGPLRRPSGSLHFRSNSNQSHRRSSPDPSLPRTNTTSSMGPPPIPPPKIVHTPATPLRSQETPRPGTAPTSHAPRLSQRKDSVDSGYRHNQGGRMGTLDEGMVANSVSASRRGKERELASISGTTASSVTTTRVGLRGYSGRSTKHGSFDFERPGWSAGGIIQRSGSNGTTETGTSGTSRNTDTFMRGVRESAMGPGMAGVGTLQREASMKRGKEREEMIVRAREEERRWRKGEIPPPDERERSSLNKHGSLQPSQRKPESEESGGKSSSLSKKRGVLGGKIRATTLGLAHGPFDFEPPVPSPTWSTGSASTGTGGVLDAPLSVSWGGERGRDGSSREKERARVKDDPGREKERERGKGKQGEKKHQSYRGGDRAPVPVPAPNVGYRSGTKGRSLDLGLGLAWAPSKVREDALLPNSGYFGRSLNGSYGGGPAGSNVSGSATENGADERERSKVGRKVAEVFRNALDEDGYAAFKRFVHQFDAHDIPFDGPKGIVSRVENLLVSAPNLSDEGKRRLLDDFVRIILQNA